MGLSWCYSSSYEVDVDADDEWEPDPVPEDPPDPDDDPEALEELEDPEPEEPVLPYSLSPPLPPPLELLELLLVDIGPLLTLMVTSEPRSAMPLAGFWLMTVSYSQLLLNCLVTFTVKPACSKTDMASLRLNPSTSGTSTGSGPRESTYSTVDPLATEVPAAGFWLMILSRATSLEYWAGAAVKVIPALLASLWA